MLRVFGSELSPYSVKVRSYLRYKHIPHEWIIRSSANEEEFRRHAKLPLIPLVLAPDGRALQDSTPIIEALERENPSPSIEPADPVLAFLSALVEEHADEWVNKPMFHYRWHYEADRVATAERIVRSVMPHLEGEQASAAVGMVSSRMVERLRLVGSSPATLKPIENSLQREIEILERHLGGRPYLFGQRPALADFGLYAQLYECSTDPTPGAELRAKGPSVLAWIERMLDPKAEGDFESWNTLRPTLLPLLREEIGRTFLPWSDANARAIAAGEKELRVTLHGEPFSQEPQKYAARSLAALRKRYAAIADRSALDSILEEAECLVRLKENR